MNQIREELLGNALGFLVFEHKRTGTIGEDAINQAVKSAKPWLQDAPDSFWDEFKNDLLKKVNVWVGVPKIMEGNEKHHPWLKNAKSKIDWDFWKRYRTYLIRHKRWAPKVVQSIDDATDLILGKIGNPKLPDQTFDRRGMVVGDVQSGKTANYTGLICKAVDAGYQLVIVMAGLHNNLRSQTQFRLDEEFLGFDTEKTFINTGNSSTRIGVSQVPPGKYLHVAALTSRTEDGDFRRKVAETVNIQPGAQPILLVIKKNRSVLDHIIKYFENSPLAKIQESSGKINIPNVPLLLIDDEADNASVNTAPINEDGTYDQDVDPTSINRRIRRILDLFPQKSYVGYTATPFANIFIHHGADHEKYGSDIFPRDFIVSLDTPSNYMGPAEVFGLDNEGFDKLPLVREIVYEESFIPQKHRKYHIPKRIPYSLKKAIRVFILSAAIRRVRGQKSVHNSMLIHVTRFNDVQDKVAELVKDEFNYVHNRLQYGDGDSYDIKEEFRQLWVSDFVPTTADFVENPKETWAAIKDELRTAADQIVVKIINGKVGDILDYHKNKDTGISVIAIGGDKLSRGLTLEGLTVSYYLRASRMYDTLLQMGRWFGYRMGYKDLCRIYTTSDLIKWYSHIAVSSNELRELFDSMVNQGYTPKDFGLRVRDHPDMMVTSRIKMRSARKMTLSYDGTISETISFDFSENRLCHNHQLTDSFLKELGPSNLNDIRTDISQSIIWTNISGGQIHDFIERFQTHPDSPKAQSYQLAQYISKQLKRGALTNWTVVLVSVNPVPGKSESPTIEIGGHTVRTVTRVTKSVSSKKKSVAIGRLVSRGDEKYGLSEDEQKKYFEKFPDRKKIAGPQARSMMSPQAGLLLIYPIDVKGWIESESDLNHLDEKCNPIGIALSFPKDEDAEKVDYVVNPVYQDKEI